MRKTREQIEYQLSIKRNRLELYLKREAEMLDGGVQSYGIGSRNLARYNTDLGSIRAAIKQLEADIEALEAALNGEKPRKSCGSSAPRLVKEAPKGAFFIGRRREFSLLFSRPGHLHHEGGEHHQQKKKQKPPTKQAAAAAPRE